MSEKVKLPREVAEAIENVRGHYKVGAEFDLNLMDKEKFEGTIVISLFANESRENMIRYFQALVNGYEVEETPEEKVKNIYQYYLSAYSGFAAKAIMEVLDVLEIKIEGVNV
jgi:hypothetical protein